MSGDSLPAPLSWLSTTVRTIGLVPTLVLVLLAFALNVVYAEQRKTHEAVEANGRQFATLVQIELAMCLNQADDDLKVGRCRAAFTAVAGEQLALR